MTAQSTNPMRIVLAPASILRVLAICTVALVCTHFAAIAALRQIDPIEHPGIAALAGKFLLDSEMNVPTLFQSFGLLFCGILLAAVAVVARKSQPLDTVYWIALSVLFCAMSIEEVCGFHELLIFPLRERLGLHGVFYFAWVIPGLLMVMTVGLLFLRFLLRLPLRTRLLFILAAGIYVGGAIGMEMIGGILAEQTQFKGSFADQSQASIAYLLAATVEELLEIAGVAIFAYSLLDWLKNAGVSISLSFVGQRSYSADRISRTMATERPNAQPSGAASIDRDSKLHTATQKSLY